MNLLHYMNSALVKAQIWLLFLMVSLSLENSYVLIIPLIISLLTPEMISIKIYNNKILLLMFLLSLSLLLISILFFAVFIILLLYSYLRELIKQRYNPFKSKG